LRSTDLIKEFEGFRSFSYKDLGGVWTIGYGRTEGVKEGDTTTREDEDAFLRETVNKLKDDILSLVDVPLRENEIDALISFVYNVGIGNFKRSTLLRLLNRGWKEQVPAQLTRWCKVNGQEYGGLKRRRAAEAALWSKG